MFNRILKAIARWWNSPTVPTTPPVESDPILPASSSTVPYGKDPAQYFTLNLPARRASELLALFLIAHGGGWWQGDADAPNVVDAKKAWLNPMGIAFGSISYRLGTRSTPKIDPYMEAQDVAAALAYLRKHGAELGIDVDRIALAGHSAGGQLTAEGITALGVEVACYLGLDTACYSVPDAMRLNIRDPDLKQIYVDAFGTDPAFQAKCDPLGNMKSAPPPMLLACSTQRGKANIAQANVFAEKARSFDTPAEVIEVDLPHGEMNSKLGTTDTPVAADYTARVQDFVLRWIG